jgi:hypothetical protein
LQRRRIGVLVTVAGALVLPSVAGAHLERPSYWPDPRPDTTVSPPAGGKVPKARSLASAVTGEGPGEVRVVCKHGRTSLTLLERSLGQAQTKGYRIRPSQPRRRLSSAKAQNLLEINQELLEMCAFRSIQKAINRSGNNDRVVIMPGRYTEPKSRKATVNDPRCNPSMLQGDQRGTPTPSYEYQATCQNDQNLIHVTGRAVKGDPAPVDPDRHGIPEEELGRCIRCNLQIEGSGVLPEDVLIDAGKGYKNPRNPSARPGGDRPAAACHPEGDQPNPCYSKHVVMRTDRSDGFVGRNFLLRGAKEHGFYTEETDGILLDRVKFFWNADYGHLSFTTDHNMVKNCEGYGSGDASVYPGAAPQTGEFRDEDFYPKQRFNTVIKRCDLHGSAMGYSGSMGNSVRVTHNRFYGNANGLTTDTISAPGHPGFPADGMKVDHNWFYSNNLDIYRPNPPFEPFVPQAIGTGIMWPGMNDGTFAHNWVFDNWRHGTLLLAIPDAVAGTAEGNVDEEIHCSLTIPNVAIASTSCANRYFGNHMGAVPPNFKPHPGLTKFGNRTTLNGGSPEEAPNGVDFWWDEFPTNDGNCWYDNTGPDGTRDSLTGDPALAPTPNMSLPLFLPEDCDSSVGNLAVYPVKGLILIGCFAQFEAGEAGSDPSPCYWYEMPSPPGSAAARADLREQEQLERELSKSPEADAIGKRMREISGDVSYGPQH